MGHNVCVEIGPVGVSPVLSMSLTHAWLVFSKSLYADVQNVYFLPTFCSCLINNSLQVAGGKVVLKSFSF